MLCIFMYIRHTGILLEGPEKNYDARVSTSFSLKAKMSIAISNNKPGHKKYHLLKNRYCCVDFLSGSVERGNMCRSDRVF